MKIRLIVALLLAIPTYGLSIAILLVYNYFSARSRLDRIKSAIVILSNEKTNIGTLVDGVRAEDVIAYAANTTLGILHQERGYIRFRCRIEKEEYKIELYREPGGGDGAILKVNKYNPLDAINLL